MTKDSCKDRVHVKTDAKKKKRCCKCDVSVKVKGFENTCKFPKSSSSEVCAGDFVAVDKKGAHKIICDKWQWAAYVDSPKNENDSSIATDQCGNTYVSGTTTGDEGTLKYINSDGTNANVRSNPGDSSQIFIGKSNLSGFWQWAAYVDSPRLEEEPSITTDCCGNVYVSGTTDGANRTLEFINSDGNKATVQPNSNPYDNNQIFVGKLNSKGFWQWVVYVTSDKFQEKQPTITADCCGNIYVGGVTNAGDGLLLFINTDG